MLKFWYLMNFVAVYFVLQSVQVHYIMFIVKCVMVICCDVYLWSSNNWMSCWNLENYVDKKKNIYSYSKFQIRSFNYL